MTAPTPLSLSSGPAVSGNGDAGGGIDTGRHVFNFNGSTSGLGGNNILLIAGGVVVGAFILWSVR